MNDVLSGVLFINPLLPTMTTLPSTLHLDGNGKELATSQYGSPG